VELLAGVACLDGAEISPVCLEIAQLCGRLPLLLNIGIGIGIGMVWV
jgi:hypothetical protein